MGKQQEKEQLCPMRGCWAGADSAIAAGQGPLQWVHSDWEMLLW